MAKFLFASAVALLALKIFLLLKVGPIYESDTVVYETFADIILKSHQWLNDANLSAEAAPATVLRTVGFPAVIAAGKALTGSGWPLAVVGFQVVVSIGVFFLVFYFGLSINLSPTWALIGALTYATGLQLAMDQCLMTDSLNSSVLIIAVIVFLRGAMNGQKIRWWQTSVSGLLLAVGFLMRDILPYTIISLVPLFVCRCLVVEVAHRFYRLMPCIIVCVPLFVVQQGYELWNWHRTGERFVTTVVQFNGAFALEQASKNGPNLFNGDTPLDREAGRIIKTYDSLEIIALNEALFNEGYHAPEIARMALDAYKRAWLTHPLTMLNLIRIATSERLLKLAVRPINSVCELFEWGGSRICFDYRDLYRKLFHRTSDIRLSEVFVLVVITTQNTLSIVLSAMLLIGTPFLLVLAWRNRTIGSDRQLLLLAGFWAYVVGWHLIYALVGYQDRYMMPTIPFLVFGGLIATRRVNDLRRSMSQTNRGIAVTPS